MTGAADYLLEVVKKVKNKQQEPNQPTPERYIVLLANNTTFLVNIEHITQIMQKGLVSNIPNTKPWVLGVTHYQDGLLPVINFAKWLEPDVKQQVLNTQPALDSANIKTRWSLVKQGDTNLLFSIDTYAGLIENCELTQAPTKEILSLPLACQDFIQFKVQLKNSQAYVLELKTMLDAGEELQVFLDNPFILNSISHPELKAQEIL